MLKPHLFDRQNICCRTGRCCLFVGYVFCVFSVLGGGTFAFGYAFEANDPSQPTPQLTVLHDDRQVMLEQEYQQMPQSVRNAYSPQLMYFLYNDDVSWFHNDNPTWYQGQSQGNDVSERSKNWPNLSPFSFDFFWLPKSDKVRLRNTENNPPSGSSEKDKPRMLQGASFAVSYLPGLGNHGLEMTQLRVGATLGLPGIGKNCFILVSPSFEPTFVDWDGPEPFPSVLYNASLRCTMIKQFNQRWGAMLSVAPSWCSDGRETKNAVRCPIMGGLIWSKSPRLQIRFGVAYLDRDDDYNVLPFGGIIWQPNDDWKYELMAPQLRIMRRCPSFSSVLPNESDATRWGYVGIGLGGGTWAFESIGNRADVADYTEYSIVLGLESERKGRLSWKTEFGYVFGRKIEFDNNTMRKLNIDDSVVFRLTLSI